MPHPHHKEHLCYLQNIGFVESNLDEYKTLVRNPKYVCGNCGRAAADAQNLCKPEEIIGSYPSANTDEHSTHREACGSDFSKLKQEVLAWIMREYAWQL